MQKPYTHRTLLLAVPQQLSFFRFLISLRFSSYFSVFSAAGFGFLPYRRRWAPPAAPRRARRRPHGPQAVSRGARLHLEGPQAGGGAARGPSAGACRPGGGAAGAASGVERVGVRRAGPRAKGNSAAVKAVEQRLAHRPYGDGGVAGVGPRRPDPFPSRLEDPLRRHAGYARQNCLIRASLLESMNKTMGRS